MARNHPDQGTQNGTNNIKNKAFCCEGGGLIDFAYCQKITGKCFVRLNDSKAIQYQGNFPAIRSEKVQRSDGGWNASGDGLGD